MTCDEKKEIVRIALKCILAFGYLYLGCHYLLEVLSPKEEEEIEEEAQDEHVIIRLRPVENIVQFRKHEPIMHQENKNDA